MPYTAPKQAPPPALTDFDLVNSIDEIDMGPMTLGVEFYKQRRTRHLALRFSLQPEPPDGTGAVVWMTAQYIPQ